MMLAVFALTACVHAPAATARDADAGSAAASRAQNPALMGKLVGHWVLTGVIAGQSVTHDVDADWVLQGNYVRISEVSRERGDGGQAAYEATIFVGWVASAQRFVCLWLDNTEVASGEVTCTAAAATDSLPFEFRDEHGTLLIATTFIYHPDSDTWDWRIDNMRDGRAVRFADLSLQRR
jgi:hypothetical protein